MEYEQIRRICSECQSIEVAPGSNRWISKSDNLDLYNSIVEQTNDTFSHGYCPQHVRDIGKKFNLE